MKTFSIDGQFEIDLTDLISDNHLNESEIADLQALEIGETCFIELCELKRLS